MIEACKKLSDGTEVCFPVNVEEQRDTTHQVNMEVQSDMQRDTTRKQKKQREKMVLISLHIPPNVLQIIDDLVRRGIYQTRSEFIRHAIASFIAHYKLDRLAEQSEQYQK